MGINIIFIILFGIFVAQLNRKQKKKFLAVIFEKQILLIDKKIILSGGSFLLAKCFNALLFPLGKISAV